MSTPQRDPSGIPALFAPNQRHPPAAESETTTTATTLPAGRVGRGGGDVLNTANLHAGTGQSAESGLSARTRGLRSVTCHRKKKSGLVTFPQCISLEQIAALGQWLTSGGSDLDVEGSDAQLLATGGDVLSSQHSGVRGRLITVGLDLHTTSYPANGLTAAGITQNVSLMNHLIGLFLS